ncbi:hypothetical protein K439DRAFT_1647404 [Ramaria rubella]|nr:hypothetical protein K439DRAFT_1647404 [Ramaria rubella]
MPVLVKHNIATPCCVTNGAEGTVVGWKSSKLTKDKNVLDILFVKLKNPPMPIHLDGLPVNVVPIGWAAQDVVCRLPNDDTLTITRQQVQVLPNFSMTDYGCQGRTRPNNVVDLGGCLTHQSYYTCLSRSASAGGTPNKITGGASAWLRQEFRELEILDELTKLRYERKLPKDYQLWKGINFVPKHVHAALLAEDTDCYIDKEVTDANASKHEKTQNKKVKFSHIAYVAAQGSRPLQYLSHDPGKNIGVNKNKKYNEKEDLTDIPVKKKAKKEHPPPPGQENPGPLGVQWNSTTSSCAYDALITIMHLLWEENNNLAFNTYASHNRHWQLPHSSSREVENGTITFERARDRLQQDFHRTHPCNFPINGAYTKMFNLSIPGMVLNTHSGNSLSVICDILNWDRGASLAGFSESPENHTVQQWYQVLTTKRTTARRCFVPELVVFHITNAYMIEISHNMITQDTHDNHESLSLAGIVYYDAMRQHFVARVVDKQGDIWYHDGINTRNRCVYEGNVSAFDSTQLRIYKGCIGITATLLIYKK